MFIKYGLQKRNVVRWEQRWGYTRAFALYLDQEIRYNDIFS